VSKIFKFFSHIKNIIAFSQLPKTERRLVFYSEGKNYWVHLEGLIHEILNTSDIPVCYISSSEDDPGLFLIHANYHTFEIDEGFIRNWLFENIDTEVMVMTMPDLNQYQVKKSKFNVHYVYVQHSLVSFHMVYRKGAFDYYDTIFCAGPHHLKEIRAIESKENLPPKKLLEHGYGRLDAIIKTAQQLALKSSTSRKKHLLIAPSWGPTATIETGIGEKIVDELIRLNFKVTLRPHPQTIKFSQDKVDAIVSKHQKNALFDYESNVAGQESLHDSDIMISDWSGAALDYAFGLNKPVLFVDVPRKINNPDYESYNIEPFEVYIRTEIGAILDLENLAKQINELSIIKAVEKSFFFNVGESSKVGAKHLTGILEGEF
jgi:hypothetical protein